MAQVPELTIVRGGFAAEPVLLDAAARILGRAGDSDVLLDDVTVSPHHAQIRRTEDGGLEVRDLGSVNGTYVNGRRTDCCALADGDELRIGAFRLCVHAHRRAS
ncbi:MAG TPA: FHA domain-containing protein [Actinomycetes bacterium]